MAPRKRRRVPATVNGHRQNCAENLTNGTPSVGGFLRTNASPKASVRYPFKRQREHEQTISNPKSNRNAEDTVSKDPKLNGRLVPTVSLESSTDSPIFRRRKGPPETKSSIHSLKLNDEGPNRALRTRNRPPNTLKASNHHGSPKMFKLPPMEMCRVKPRESLSCLNMLAPVFADCKLNGAVAPRVVLKRLDIDTILQNGVTSLGPRKTRSSPNLPSSRDLKPRTKSRVRFKGVGTSRNLKTPRAPGVSGTARTRTSRGSRKRRRGFEPVPVHEKKWWNSFPLKHVAVRLTKLPL